MKKAISLLIALLMTVSVLFSVPVSAYSSTETNAISETNESTTSNENDESVIMKIIHTIFFSKLTFDSNGGSEVPYQYAFKFFGKFKTPAEPQKEGYTFDGWEPEIPSRAPFQNVNVKAKWKTNVYTVKWIVDGATYSSTELPYGVGISMPKSPQKEGYKFVGWSPAVEDVMPAHDLTYTAQFSVKSYTVTLNAGSGKFTNGKNTKKVTAAYGSKVNYEEPKRDGYLFAGWDIVIPSKMPAYNFTCNATWVARKDTVYTVYIYVMNVNGKYSLNQKNTLSGETDATVTYTPKPDKGFKTGSNSILSATVAADGSTVLKVYYARNSYKIKFDLDNGSKIITQNYFYGATPVPPKNLQKEGYNFLEWTPAIAKVTKAVTYKVKWKRATEYVQASTEEEYIEECARLFDESVNDAGFNSAEAVNDPYYMGRLVITCDDYSLIDFDNFDAEEVVFGTDGTVVIQFPDRDKAEDCAKILESLSAVEAVAADAYLEMEDYDVEPIPNLNNERDWGVEYIGADRYSYYLKNTTKDKTVTVAVLDTGIDTDHPYLKNVISKGGINFTGAGTTPEDDHGHGTHVSGIIKQCTEGLNINILPVRVLRKNGEGKAEGSLKWIIDGISWAVQSGADIINLSLEVPANPIITNIIKNAIDYAISEGVTVVVAAGNGEETTHNPVDTSNVAPANIDSAIVVAAIDKNGIKGSFSNYGETVDVCAPGVEIESTYLKTAEFPYEYGKLDGTSQAAPHITAVAAMFKYLNKNLTPVQIESLVKQYCEDKGPVGRDDFYGEGCPNIYNAIPDCTISFNIDGGSSISSFKVKSTETIVLPNPSKYYKVTFDTCGGTAVNPYNSQCIFGGWFESASLSGASHPAKESYMVKENVTLYAKWTNNGFESPPNPTRDYYEFAGWYTSQSEGTNLGKGYLIEDNITVYAHWTLKPESDWVSENAVPAGAMITDRIYRYRDVHYNQVISDWSAWQVGSNTASETVEVATVYRYDAFECVCGQRYPTQKTCSCGRYVSDDGFRRVWSPISFAGSGSSAYSSGKYGRRQTTSLGDGKKWFFYSNDLNCTNVGRVANGTGSSDDLVICNGYRTRTISYNPYWIDDWSNWSTTAYTASSTRQVETLVKYRDK